MKKIQTVGLFFIVLLGCTLFVWYSYFRNTVVKKKAVNNSHSVNQKFILKDINNELMSTLSPSSKKISENMLGLKRHLQNILLGYKNEINVFREQIKTMMEVLSRQQKKIVSQAKFISLYRLQMREYGDFNISVQNRIRWVETEQLILNTKLMQIENQVKVALSFRLKKQRKKK